MKNKKKYEKIEVTLTESGLIVRLVFLVIALSIATYSFYYIFTKVLHTENGWQTVTVNSKILDGNDYVFHYQFGVSEMSASIEWATLNKAYPVLLERGYKIFGTDEVSGMGNLYQLNAHPNEEVYLEPELYDALKRINTTDSRYIYYAPVFSQYKSLFNCEDDYAAMYFDPFEDEDVAAYLKSVCDYVKDANHIHLELLDGNMAKLVVSDEYNSFAAENEIDTFVDFYYAKNAFLLDYVAEGLVEKGYKAGVITSVEGFVRALGEGDYQLKYYEYRDNEMPLEKMFSYSGPKSVVSLRDYMLYKEDSRYLYKMEDGTTRHIFVDPETGLSRDGVHEVLVSSSDLGCGDIFIALYDAFVEGEEAIYELNKQGMQVEK